MASPSYSVSSIRALFSPTNNHTPLLCLRLPSTAHFYTVRDQASGSTSLEFHLRCSCFSQSLTSEGLRL